MKKLKQILALSLCVVSLTAFASACSEPQGNSFVDLNDDEILYVGENEMFVNTTITTEEVYTHRHIAHRIYSLQRSSSAPSASVLYGYDGLNYYYWNITNEYDEVLLGTKTTTITTTYSYLITENQENIVVKTKTVESYSFDFEGGLQPAPTSQVTTYLNDYITSSHLEVLFPELVAQTRTEVNKRFYVDTTLPQDVHYSVNSYNNTYAYIETE